MAQQSKNDAEKRAERRILMYNDEYKNLNDKITSDEKLLSEVIEKLDDPEKIKHRPLYRPWTLVITVVLALGFIALVAVLAKAII